MAEVTKTDGVIHVDGVAIATRNDLLVLDAETGLPVVDAEACDFVAKYPAEVAQQIYDLLAVPDDRKAAILNRCTCGGKEVFAKLREIQSVLDQLVSELEVDASDVGGDVLYESMRQMKGCVTKFSNSKRLYIDDIGECVMNIRWAKAMIDTLMDPDNPQSALNPAKDRAMRRSEM